MTLSLCNQLNLGSVEIVVRGLLRLESVTEENLEHLYIARDRLNAVIDSIETDCNNRDDV